jgi:2-polyprenyl-6-methoxyphenol hydroxylase-like FAD-dependent oxidoreductase
MSEAYDIVIVGGGIAGGALAATLARGGVSVAVLERDREPVDRVRGEFMALWGVCELERLGLLGVLEAGGGIYSRRNIPYDENTHGEQALAYALTFKQLVPDVPGALCMSHPAMCSALCHAAGAAGATVLRGVEEIQVSAGTSPSIAFRHERRALIWRPRLIVGADGRNSRLRQQLSITLLADPPHNLLGGMLVEGVPEWPQDTQVIGTERRSRAALCLLRLCRQGAVYRRRPPAEADRDLRPAEMPAARRRHRPVPSDWAVQLVLQRGPLDRGSDRAGRGADRRRGRPQRPDHRAGPVDRPARRAAGERDPPARKARTRRVRPLRGGTSRAHAAPAHRRAARHHAACRFGEAARQRRAQVQKRLRVDRMPSPLPACMLGPDRLPAEHFEQATLDALLAP